MREIEFRAWLKNRKKIFDKDIVKLNGYLWEVYSELLEK